MSTYVSEGLPRSWCVSLYVGQWRKSGGTVCEATDVLTLATAGRLWTVGLCRNSQLHRGELRIASAGAVELT